MTDDLKLCWICGERPLRGPDMVMCVECFARIDSTYQKAKQPAEE